MTASIQCGSIYNINPTRKNTLKKILILVPLLVVVLVGCADGSTEPKAKTTTTIQAQADEATTTTAPEGFLLTTSSWVLQWNEFTDLFLGASGSSYDEITMRPHGEHLFGSRTNYKTAVYVEAQALGGQVQSSIVAAAPGSPTPVRLVAAAGANLVDPHKQIDVLTAFNGKVVPELGTLSSYETKFEVTDDLDLLVLVKNADPLELLFIWTPSGVSPSEFARAASF